jgi:hypothetical protein
MEPSINNDLAALSLAQHDEHDDEADGHDNTISSGGAKSSSSTHTTDATMTVSTCCTFVCDLQYGFPNERRPRREKIGAIAAQLGNFFDWQYQQLQKQQQKQANATAVLQNGSCRGTSCCSDADEPNGGRKPVVTAALVATPAPVPAAVLLVHLARDDDAVKEILSRLLLSNEGLAEQQQTTAAVGDDNHNGTLVDRSGDDPTKQHQQQQQQRRHRMIQATTVPLQQVVNAMKGKVIYLSPDADTVLSSSSSSSPVSDNDAVAPLRSGDDDDDDNNQQRHGTTDYFSCIIVGGLIDRRHIQTNRSLLRATTLAIPTARWPLPVDWDDHEPLNVDCILQGMQDWLWTGDLQRAIADALAAHVRRHPGRPQHKKR